MPCTLVRLVQFSKVFVALTTTILVYHSHFSLSTGFLTFFKSYFHQPRYTHSPYGIRTRVTAVKRRCLNPLTNGPELFNSFYYTYFFCLVKILDLFFYLFGEKSLSTCFSSFNIAFLPLNRSSANSRSNNSNFSFPNPARYSLSTSCNV